MKTIYKIIFLLFVVHNISAQNAKTFFFDGAKKYINKEYDQALNIVNDGLKIYPYDKKLNVLKKKIEEKKDEQQNNDQQNQDNKDQDNKDQQNKDQQNKDQKDKQDKDKQQQDKQDQQNQQDKQQQQKQEQQQAGKLSKEDAKRMLDAIQNDENNLQDKLKKEKAYSAKKVKPEVDW